MKAVLEGFASVAPRRLIMIPYICSTTNESLVSVVPNLIEILGALLSRAGGGTGGGGGAGGAVAATWMSDILLAVSYSLPVHRSTYNSFMAGKFRSVQSHTRS